MEYVAKLVTNSFHPRVYAPLLCAFATPPIRRSSPFSHPSVGLSDSLMNGIETEMIECDFRD